MPAIVLNTINDLELAATTFIKDNAGRRIFAFYGEMGAGKTTLIRAICQKLGSIDTVTSPTFTIVNEYFTSSGDTLYHFDFYRIEKTEELFDIGFEEYLESDRVCFMEWPEKIEEWLPEGTVKVRISVNDDMSRIIRY